MKKTFILIAVLAVLLNIILTLTVFKEFGYFSKYPTLGREIVNTGILCINESFEYSPLYSIACAMLYPLFQNSLTLYTLVINILSGINVYVLMLIALRLFDYKNAVISGIIFTVSSPLLIYNTDLLAAPIVLFLNSASILFFLYWTNTMNTRHIRYSGLFLGLSVITRPNVLVFVCLASLYLLLIKQYKPLLNFIIPILLCILPITSINYIRTGNPVLVEDSGPPIFYSSNNYNSIGIGYAPPGVLQVLESRFERGQEFTPETSRLFKDIAIALHDREMNIKEINRFYINETLKQLKGDPKRYINLSLLRIWYALHFFEDYDVISSLRRKVLLERLPTLPTGIIIVLGIIGLCLYGAKKHIKDPIIIIYILSYLIFFLLFYVTERLRLPMVFIFIPFASSVLISLHSMIRQKEIKKSASIILSMLLLTFALNYENNDIKFRREHTKPKFLYQQNIIRAFYQNDHITLLNNSVRTLELDPLYDSVWFYLNAIEGGPDLPHEYLALIKTIKNRFSISYDQIIQEYSNTLKEDPFNLEALKFVSSYYVQAPLQTDEFLIVADMLDIMKAVSPADPEVYYIEAYYHNRTSDIHNAVQSIEKAIEYGILYSKHYKDSALLASHLFLLYGNRESAVASLRIMKNLFPEDRDYIYFIENRGLI